MNDDNGEISGNIVLYEEVLAALPSRLKVISAESYGTSAWSLTGRINAIRSDGSPASFFVKYVMKDHGRPQLEGEYEGMLELYKTVPHMVPKPHAWGKVESASTPTYFYLCDFVNLSDALPDPVKLGELVADLHKKSVSPNGMFGFHITTYDGWQPQEVGWEKSWTTCFSNLLAGVWKTDYDLNGHWAELDAAMERTLSHVIPRLIGILESDGRTIKPCLIHGDLWEGNIGTDLDTGEVYIYDAAAYYAHNEMEIGMWRVEHHRTKAKAYRKEYVKHFRRSDPVEEWDDRLRLYGVKTKLMYSATVPKGDAIRNQALEDLRFLIQKYDNDETPKSDLSDVKDSGSHTGKC